jgi:uncharacterized Ntn-hydrolase superfamily protein
MTFSILAYDPETQSWGLAVASRISSIGAVVPHGRWPHGIIATQALVPNFGDQFLEALMQENPLLAIQEVMSRDPYLNHRQIALSNRDGQLYYFQGCDVQAEAGYVADDLVSAQGNMLVNTSMLHVMVSTYLADPSPDFGDRLLRALDAGERAGGDRRIDRSWYSAALLIVGPCRSDSGTSNCKVDLRIDQSPSRTPIQDLWNLYHDRRFEPSDIKSRSSRSCHQSYNF